MWPTLNSGLKRTAKLSLAHAQFKGNEMNIIDFEAKLDKLTLPAHSMERIVRLANNLSNEDLARLLTIVAPRLEVFVGVLNGVCVNGEITGASTNGTIVQIDMTTAELDDLSEDSIFGYAIQKQKPFD